MQTINYEILKEKLSKISQISESISSEEILNSGFEKFIKINFPELNQSTLENIYKDESLLVKYFVYLHFPLYDINFKYRGKDFSFLDFLSKNVKNTIADWFKYINVDDDENPDYLTLRSGRSVLLYSIHLETIDEYIEFIKFCNKLPYYMQYDKFSEQTMFINIIKDIFESRRIQNVTFLGKISKMLISGENFEPDFTLNIQFQDEVKQYKIFSFFLQNYKSLAGKKEISFTIEYPTVIEDLINYLTTGIFDFDFIAENIDIQRFTNLKNIAIKYLLEDLIYLCDTILHFSTIKNVEDYWDGPYESLVPNLITKIVAADGSNIQYKDGSKTELYVLDRISKDEWLKTYTTYDFNLSKYIYNV